MPGVLLWGYDTTNKVWIPLQVDSSGRLKVVATTKIQDADADTKVDTEESADEDHVRMDVKGVEAFLLTNDGILNLAKQSLSRGYKSQSDGSQTIPPTTFTKLIMTGESFDVQGEYDAANSKMTVKQPGTYLIMPQVYWEPVVDGDKLGMFLYINGVYVIGLTEWAVATGFPQHPVWVWRLSTNDDIEIYVYNYEATNKTVYKGEYWTFMAVAKLM